MVYIEDGLFFLSAILGFFSYSNCGFFYRNFKFFCDYFLFYFINKGFFFCYLDFVLVKFGDSLMFEFMWLILFR